MQEISQQEIEWNLQKLKLTTNTDIIGIDCKLLRMSSSIISGDLTAFINLSIQSGSVPQDWKIARVTPLYKGDGDKDDPSNYRPIPVVCHIAKVFEKVIANQSIQLLSVIFIEVVGAGIGIDVRPQIL